MPTHRVVYQATGNDVSDVIIDGRIVMRDRAMQTLDERAVIDTAEDMYRRVLDRAGLDLNIS